MSQMSVRQEPIEKKAVAWDDFEATRMNARPVKEGKFFIGRPLDFESENDLFLDAGEVSHLQEKNPKTPILINADGNVAKVGELCKLNSDIFLQREQVLSVASK